MPASDYTPIVSNPVVSGDFEPHGCDVVNIGLQWQSSLQKIPTLSGAKGVPDIPKGQIVVSLLVPPSGVTGGNDIKLTNLTSVVMVYVNGTWYDNTYHAGGQLQTKDLGEGRKALIASKFYTVFGLSSTST